MGHEIVYCASCRGQLRGADFDKGKAGRVAGQAYCLACLDGLGLTPDAAVGAMVAISSLSWNSSPRRRRRSRLHRRLG